MEIDKDSLEKALNSDDLAKLESTENSVQDNLTKSQPRISKEEEIGFHKGAFNTLVAERAELFKMIGNVEAIMQAHLKRLEELGVKIEMGKRE